MGFWRTLIKIKRAALFFGITVILYVGDQAFRFSAVQDQALQQSRQIITQVEALVIYARESGIENSVEWATRFLNQGGQSGVQNGAVNDPRIIRVFPAKMPLSISSNEIYELNRKSGEFDYLKILQVTPNDAGTRASVRVLVSAQPIRFLGFRNRLFADLVAFGLWLGLVFVFRKRKHKIQEPQKSEESELPLAPQPMTSTFEPKQLLNWILDSRATLKDMTKQLKSLLDRVAKMNQANIKAYELLLRFKKSQNGFQENTLEETLSCYDEIFNDKEKLTAELTQTTLYLSKHFKEIDQLESETKRAS
jgi:hypothetical protein